MSPVLGVEGGKLYFDILPGEDEEVRHGPAKQAAWGFSLNLQVGNIPAASENLIKGLGMPEDMVGNLVRAYLKKGDYGVIFDCTWDPVDPEKPSVKPRHYEKFRTR